jgi:hypothetical protein
MREALTHSVELLASLHKDTERVVGSLAKRHTRLEELVTEIAEGTARLLRSTSSASATWRGIKPSSNPVLNPA